MRAILILGISAILAHAVPAAPVPKEVKFDLAEKLGGEWRMVKSDALVAPTPYTFTIHFMKAGELEFRRQYPDREPHISTGKYKTGAPDSKNRLGTIDWTVGEGDLVRGEISKILSLSEGELVFEDPAGIKESFVRLKTEKKKDAK